MGPVRARFAPSPTGYLHIGGVRTALFNWLLVKRYGGQFILRIDDTDNERNKPEALQPILDGFRWLGIQWDEGPEVGGPLGPYFQSQRLEGYREAAHKLVQEGKAYPCLLSPEELKAEREAAERAKKPYIHRGPGRNLAPEEALKLVLEGKPVRLKVTEGRKIVLEDLIRGRVEWDADLLGDPVILRGDGRALYNFATVVDDAAMQITHVVRAAEHLSNTAVQLVAFEALGVGQPRFAHVPVVNEPNSKKKLSKRDMAKFVTTEIKSKLMSIGHTAEQIAARDDLNPATVAFYRELGYLPEGLVNYLGRLGWSLDDHSEIIPIDLMTANFSLERVNDSPASFDPDKLYWVAGEYMKTLPLEKKVEGVLPFLKRAGIWGENESPARLEQLRRVITASGDRLKLFSDILQYGLPILRPSVAYDEKSFAKRVTKEGVPVHLAEFIDKLAALPDFEAATLEDALKAHATDKGFNPALLIHGLRVSTTGIEVGAGVYDILSILGKDESIRRVRNALAKAGLV
jgi:glutamyl/glutaminyl-tRNA synthetase